MHILRSRRALMPSNPSWLWLMRHAESLCCQMRRSPAYETLSWTVSWLLCLIIGGMKGEMTLVGNVNLSGFG